MGNKALSGGNPFESKDKTKLASKLDVSKKTGVLNLSDMKLSLKSDIWAKIEPNTIKLIDVSGNSIKSLPVEIYSMTNLKKLKCSRCDLERIFSAIVNNVALTNIDADFNKLQVDMVGTLPSSVTQINFSHNLLCEIPPSIYPLGNLITLDVSFNRIESLTGIGELVSLTDLNADDNIIPEINSELAKLPKLRRVSLKRNRIGVKAVTFEGQSIHVDFFVLSSVDSMNLQGNPLTKSNIHQFDGITEFMERRKRQKDKTLLMGASTDLDLFGLD